MVINILFALGAATIMSAAVATPKLANPLMDQHDFWACCWRQLILFAFINGAVGVAAGGLGYASSALMGGKIGGNLVGIGGGALVGQLLVRCDGFVADPASPTGDRQSIFNWASRYFRGRLYCRLIDQTSDGLRLRDRVANGLVVAYDEFEIGRFITHAVPAHKRWTDKIVKTLDMTPVEKREALADRLLRDSFDFAKGRVKDRASIIVERGGF